VDGDVLIELSGFLAFLLLESDEGQSQLSALASAPAEHQSIPDGQRMESSAANCIEAVTVTGEDAALTLSPHMKQSIEEESSVFVAAAELKGVMGSIDGSVQKTDGLLQVNWLWIVCSQLLGVIFSPSEQPILSQKDRVVVARSQSNYLFVLEGGEDLRSPCHSLPPLNNCGSTHS
jgi:hypothetical protein